jgi:hypothetical protein
MWSAFSRGAGIFALLVCVALGAAVQPAPTTSLADGSETPLHVRVAVPDRANATPSIVADGSRVALAWSAREASGKTDIYVATSADGGRTYGEPVRVNDEPGAARVGGEMPPRVVLTGSAVDVLWTSRSATGTTIRIARSENGGRTFSTSRELQQEGAPGDRGWPALSVDGSGRPHAVWLDHRGLADPAGARHVHGAARNPEEKHDGVAMAQKSALLYSHGAGEHEIAKGVCYCCKTALVNGPEHTVFAAWRHVFAGNIRDIAFTMSRDGGRTFASPVRISEDQWQLDGCPDDGPALAVDAQGGVHAVWPTVVSQPEPHKAIFYASTRDGRTFTERLRVSTELHNAAHPQVAIDPRGNVFVVWDEIIDGRRQVVVSHRRDRQFTPPTPIGTTAPAWYPAIARTSDGILIAATEGASSDTTIGVHRVSVLK